VDHSRHKLNGEEILDEDEDEDEDIQRHQATDSNGDGNDEYDLNAPLVSNFMSGIMRISPHASSPFAMRHLVQG